MYLKNEDFKFIRMFYRLTADEMGALSGISASLIYRIEKGERNLTPKVAARVIREFQLSDFKLEKLKQAYKLHSKEKLYENKITGTN
jgi:transcriptional regulator with XRE-family HTH domain